jgi:hypothetical protein
MKGYNMKMIKSLVLGAAVLVGGAFAGPSVDLTLSKSLNVEDLRHSNLAVGPEVASLRVGMGDFRLSVNGLDMDKASATLGMKHDVVGFDHVNVMLDKHSVGLGVSRDASIAGALSLTAGTGLVASDISNLPSWVASVGLSYNVW